MSFSTKCVRFEGVGEYVTMGNVLDLASYKPFSISVWLKTTQAGVGVILTKADATTWQGITLYMGGVGRVILYIASDITSNDYIAVRTVDAVNTGLWTHIAVTADCLSAAGVTFYVNGAPVAVAVIRDTLAGSASNSTDPFRLGIFGDDTSSYVGRMDELAIYGETLLSAADVAWIFNDGRPRDLLDVSAPAGLMAWWRMGEGDTYPTLLDSTPYAYSGTMTGMTAADIFSDSPDLGYESTVVPAAVLEGDASGVGSPEGVVFITGGGAPATTVYYKMRARDAGAVAPGYVTWVATNAPDFAGASYATGLPTPVGAMVASSAVVVSVTEV